MISTLIVDKDKDATDTLKTLLSDNCPHISICGKTETYKDALDSIKELNPDLVFLGIDSMQQNCQEIFDIFYPIHFEIIITSTLDKFAISALNCGASGYLLKPIQKDELLTIIHNTSQRIRDNRRGLNYFFKKSYQNNGNVLEELIGIPTIEGYEFVPVRNIIRCEGMQKCTRIITVDKTDMISSYNIGKFKKLLDQYGFYSPHKSHLINLNMVRKYHKEGSIFMLNGSWIPVAKRRKKDFLYLMKYI